VDRRSRLESAPTSRPDRPDQPAIHMWRGGAALGLALAIGLAVGSADGDGHTPAKADPAPILLERLGSQRHPIQGVSPEVQSYFDQGLILTFGFNHEAAVRSFEHAAKLDPSCAMCFWGTALALGPNINAPMGPEAGRRAYAAAQRAKELAESASARERAYIDALLTRYAAEPPEERRRGGAVRRGADGPDALELLDVRGQAP